MRGVFLRDIENYFRSLRDSEIRTTKYLGCKTEVLQEEPVYKLKITINSPKYDGAKMGAACSLVFTLPPLYPKHSPTIEIIEIINLNTEFVARMALDFESILDHNIGSELILAITTRAVVMLKRFDSLSLN